MSLVVFSLSLRGQTISARLSKAWVEFEKDPQMQSGIASICVMDATTGNIIFGKNTAIGLGTASTMKVITSAAAYDLLGKDFRYHTHFGYFGTIRDSQLAGSIYIKPSGDPTLGSWRWNGTKEEQVLTRISTAVQKSEIKNFSAFITDVRGWEGENIPDGWTWSDIGNYYGAGAAPLNWRENQYDLILKSGSNIGDAVSVVKTEPELYNFDFISFVTSAAAGTGDNAYIYFPLSGSTGFVRGTIPVNENAFSISGAMPDPQMQFLQTLNRKLQEKGVQKSMLDISVDRVSKANLPEAIIGFHTEVSPTLDSISYYFLKRSVNLYGEALVKTIARAANRPADYENGLKLIKQHFISHAGVKETELNIHDGSGLSRYTKVTSLAQVKILQYAKKQGWFQSYLQGFPEYNGMKMKSGTSNGIKGYCGYHTSRNGKQYIFSFLVNNYNGSSSSLVQKMYRVLNVLK